MFAALLPFLPLIAAGITAYSSKSSNDANAQAQMAINDRNIAFQTGVNAQQREWALADFDKTNQYNSPLQQMQRLREAGLNPNLVYGSGAANTSAMVRSVNTPAPDLKAAHYEPIATGQFQGALSDMYNIQKTQAETDNLKAQNVLLGKESLLKDIEMSTRATESSKSQFDLNLAKELRDNTVDQARIDTGLKAVSVAEKSTGIAEKRQSMEIQRKAFPVDQLLKIATTDEMRQRIANAKKTGVLQDIETTLRKEGISPSDPMYARLILRALQNNKQKIKDGLGELKTKLKSRF